MCGCRRFKQIAVLINSLNLEKISLLLTSLIQKLHVKESRLFKDEELAKLSQMFELETSQLNDVLNCLSYTFEQSAFTSTGPEDLYTVLVDAGFDHDHAQAVTVTWAAEAAGYVAKLKDQKLGYRTLKTVDYKLNMVMHESDLSRQQEPVAVFELKIGDPTTVGKDETMQLEMNHNELYSFFAELDRLQLQIDALSKS
jgi:hypothetical protein